MDDRPDLERCAKPPLVMEEMALGSIDGTVEHSEKGPLGAAPSEVDSQEAVHVVDFVDGDPEDPLNWPYWRKLSVQMLVAVICLLRRVEMQISVFSLTSGSNFGTIIIVPAVPQLLQEFDTDNKLYSTILVSIWELGEGFGPFLVGPLSEKYGRLPIYMTGNLLFIILSVTSAVSTNISMLVAFRFLNGFAATSLVLGPSIVGDCFPREERGKSMAVAIAIPMMGPFAAPVIGGYVAEQLGWRWTIWIVTIAAGAVSLLSVFVFKESYKVKILASRARRLRQETGNALLRSRYDNPGTTGALVKSFTRPVRLLFRSPIVFIVSVYMALVYGLSFLILTTLTQIVQSVYGFTEGQAGLSFLGRAVGNMVAIFFYGITSDLSVKYMSKRRGADCPEDRLLSMLVGATLIVAGIFLYGWTAQVHTSWIAPIVGTGIIGFSMLLIILPTGELSC